MGNKKSRVIEIDNIEAHLSKCQQLSKKNCPVYGSAHLVKYNGMEFMLSQSKANHPPSLGSLHYLVPPNLLVVPQFTLLQDSKPVTVDDLFDIIVGVAELCRDFDVGVGRRRIGFAGKWGIVGQKNKDWSYQEILQDPHTKGIYLSPQQMLSLSQGKQNARHIAKKSDMFALGVMVLEMIFQENMGGIFDYTKFEMKLKPLLEKLNSVKQHFGQAVYNIILKMVELQEDDRIGFDELLEVIGQAKSGAYVEPKSSRRGSTVQQPNPYMEYNSCRTPTNNKSPNHRKNSVVIGNQNCSPFKVGCFMDNVRTPERLGRTGKTPDKAGRDKISPLKRDLRINTRFDKENKVTNAGFQTNRSPLAGRKTGVSPLSRR